MESAAIYIIAMYNMNCSLAIVIKKTSLWCSWLKPRLAGVV